MESLNTRAARRTFRRRQGRFGIGRSRHRLWERRSQDPTRYCVIVAGAAQARFGTGVGACLHAKLRSRGFDKSRMLHGQLPSKGSRLFSGTCITNFNIPPKGAAKIPPALVQSMNSIILLSLKPQPLLGLWEEPYRTVEEPS